MSSLRARRYVPAHARRSRAFRLRDRRPKTPGPQPSQSDLAPWSHNAAPEKRSNHLRRRLHSTSTSEDDLVPWSHSAAPEKRSSHLRRGLLSTLTVVVITAATVPAFALLVRSAAPEIELRIPGRLQATPAPIVLPSPSTRTSPAPGDQGDQEVTLPSPAAYPAKAHRRRTLRRPIP